MIKASSRTIVFLFPILLICAQGISGWQANNTSTRARQKPAVAKAPDTKQLEADLQIAQVTITDLQSQLERLGGKIDQTASAQQVTHQITLAAASRSDNQWVILTVASILATVIGGICGVFLSPLFRRQVESAQREQLLELSNKTAELKKESDNLNCRLGLLEELVHVIHQSLLSKGNTEKVEPDNETLPTAHDDDSTRLAQANQLADTTTNEGHNGLLASIGIVPPSEYLAAIQSSTVGCKTTTTNQDFRYPGKLIESEGGRFLILSVQEGTNLHNLALPASDRLLGSDEFTYYYKNIFECEQPVSGEIYVIAPAEMDEDTQHGGWMLSSRGKLQIRR